MSSDSILPDEMFLDKKRRSLSKHLNVGLVLKHIYIILMSFP